MIMISMIIMVIVMMMMVASWNLHWQMQICLYYRGPDDIIEDDDDINDDHDDDGDCNDDDGGFLESALANANSSLLPGTRSAAEASQSFAILVVH